MSSGFTDDPQEDDEQPPDVAACFMASKSIGFMRLSSEIVNGWLMCRVSCRRRKRKARASIFIVRYHELKFDAIWRRGQSRVAFATKPTPGGRGAVGRFMAPLRVEALARMDGAHVRLRDRPAHFYKTAGATDRRAPQRRFISMRYFRSA